MKILGQELSVIKNQFIALILNLYSWLLHKFNKESECLAKLNVFDNCCVVIGKPGGAESLKIQKLESESDNDEISHKNSIVATVGYNIASFPPPFVRKSQLATGLPEGLLLVRIKYFSVNYADICIRWGLYESAIRYVGWPIVPGFDFSGVIEISSSPDFQVGDSVFGFTMFGAYSSRLVVPSTQVRRIPEPLFHKFSLQQAAALPAVAATALHSVRTVK